MTKSLVDLKCGGFSLLEQNLIYCQLAKRNKKINDDLV